ncbi:hypothetical protein NtRootA1_29160 [Arthrobacter sp. NtRootA1]|nr:hypothetical protein NtRootA1_29160 [Arthrobacter sp. NtRootA1]
MNDQFTALQGLSEGIQDTSFKLGSLVKEEDPTVCPRGSTRAGKSRTSADDGSCSSTVVGILEGGPPEQCAG